MTTALGVSFSGQARPSKSSRASGAIFNKTSDYSLIYCEMVKLTISIGFSLFFSIKLLHAPNELRISFLFTVKPKLVSRSCKILLLSLVVFVTNLILRFCSANLEVLKRYFSY